MVFSLIYAVNTSYYILIHFAVYSLCKLIMWLYDIHETSERKEKNVYAKTFSRVDFSLQFIIGFANKIRNKMIKCEIKGSQVQYMC